jgi:hypothetical protein
MRLKGDLKMRKERFIYKGQEFEADTFETEVVMGSGKEMEQIDALLKEEADTKSGKRKIKPVDKRRKPIKIGD